MSIQPRNGTPISLAVLLEGENVAPYRETPIASCGVDASETFRAGLFVCRESDEKAALDAITTAAANGAVAAVVAKGEWEAKLTTALEKSGVATEYGEFQVVFVDDPRSVWARTCQAFQDFPARKLKTIAVTGTAGKTSASYIVGGMLAEAGRSVGLIGSLGVYDGKKLAPLSETTPEPAALAELLARMVDNGCSCAIIEASSVALAERRLEGIEFDAVCLTNLRRDHLDYHRTVDQYRRVKMRIFDYLKKDAIAICNVDDRVTDAALHLINCPTLTIGIQPTECDVAGRPVERQRGEQTFYIVAGTDGAPVRSRIVGKEHIYNCLTAAALGVAWNIDLKTIARGVERVEYIPGRMEQIDCGQPFGVYLDCASSPESLNETIETLRSVAGTGAIYCVLSAPNDSDRSKRPLMGRTAESTADYVVVTRGNLPQAQARETLDDLLHGFKNPEKASVIADRKDAIIWALSQAGPEDVVLVVGHDVSTLDDVDESFVADRQFIRHWLYENQPCLEQYWY